MLAISCDAIYTLRAYFAMTTRDQRGSFGSSCQGAALRAYADTEGIPFDLLSDHWPHGAIAQAFGVFDEEAGCARRGTFVLDSTGMIKWQQINQIDEPREIAAVLAATANL